MPRSGFSYAGGTPADQKTEIDDLLEGRLNEAALRGAPPAMIVLLRKLVYSRVYNMWRVQLCGSDAACRLPAMRIRLKPGAKYAPRKPYQKPQTPAKLKFWIEHLAMLEKAKVVRRTKAPPAPAFLVKKKNPLDPFRLVVDEQQLNLVSEEEYYPSPLVHELLQLLVHAECFASFDFIKGFWQMLVDPRDTHLLAFQTPVGCFEFLRCVMGAMNSGTHLVRQTSYIFSDTGMLWRRLLLLIDDACVWGRTPLPASSTPSPATPARVVQPAQPRLDTPYVRPHDGLLEPRTQKESWRELYDRIEEFLLVCHKYGLKCHPRKQSFFSTSLTYLGWNISKTGVSVTQDRIQGLVELGTPTTVFDIQQFDFGTIWVQKSIPNYVVLATPIRDFVKRALGGLQGKVKQRSQRALLSDHGWDATLQGHFDNMKKALIGAVTRAYPDPAKHICQFSDASMYYWCAMITQIPMEDIGLPLEEQRHEMLAFKSGKFTHNQMRWAIPDKEAYPLVHAAEWFPTLMNHRRHTKYCDAKNIIYVLQPEYTPKSLPSTSMRRINRWKEKLMDQRYDAFHLDGERNVWCDMGSRWGAPGLRPVSEFTYVPTNFREIGFAVPPVDVLPTTAADPVGPTASPTAPPADEATPSANGAEASPVLLPAASVAAPLTRARAFRVPFGPEVRSSSIQHPKDINLTGRLRSQKQTVWPTLAVIRTAQHAAHVQPPLKLDEDRSIMVASDGDGIGKVWIPDTDLLRERIMIAAHQASMGHRGWAATWASLKLFCTWSSMKADAKEFVSSCIQCVKNMAGEMIARPMGSQIQAEAPGEVITMDWITMPMATDGSRYLLTLKDGLSSEVSLHASSGQTAFDTVPTLMDWCAHHGVPAFLITDRGTHFLNQLMEQVQKALRFDHHITTAHAAWTHGSVENMNKHVVNLVTLLCSEFKIPTNEWPKVIPMVCFALNHAPLPSNTSTGPDGKVDARSPIEISTGRKPPTQLSAIFWHGVNLHNVRTSTVSLPSLISKAMAARTAWSNLAFQEISALRMKRSRYQKQLRQRNNGKRSLLYLPEFKVGSYVLVGRAALGAKLDKITLRWQGPFVVVSVVAPLVYKVHLVGPAHKDAVKRVHAARLRMFADSFLNVTEEVKDLAQHDLAAFVIEKITQWRISDASKMQLNVRWLGFTAADDSWEYLHTLQLSHRHMVTKFLASRKNSSHCKAALTKIITADKAQKKSAAKQRRKDAAAATAAATSS